LTELKLFCTSTTRYGIISATELGRRSRAFEAKADVCRVYSENFEAS
jgi:hypothetical protein